MSDQVLGSGLKGTVVDKDEIKVLGVKCVGLNDMGTKAGEAMKKLKLAIVHVPSWKNRSVHYGIMPNVDSQHNDDTNVYYVAFEVENFEVVPQEVEALTIPSSRYAVVHKNASNTFKQTYRFMFSYTSSLGLQDRWNEDPVTFSLEIYDQNAPDEMDLCFTVK